MMTRSKPREVKENSVLKCRSQIESEHQKAEKQSRQHRFKHLPKNHEINIFSLLSFLSKNQIISSS
jgi:hypothetical protein